MTFEIDGDLRYLQEADAPHSEFRTWELTENPFERKLATNLRPGVSLDLDVPALNRVLGSAALLLDKTITVDLVLGPKGIGVRVVEVSDALLPLWADGSGNLTYALNWFRQNGEHALRLSVCADAFFWIHRNK
ncbi:hypothetical protein [Pseudomonas sp. BN102]|uniref:hypothetical protein n=1 Tax=Pseudomonas sp. BN102 TaxID=2567886 RepID=UPI002458D591|nr:hypothetical protein [Pseudomonas sp. BN102]MDH4610313.1 hypothetical protein [Pseudomonas sp. BN102]